MNLTDDLVRDKEDIASIVSALEAGDPSRASTRGSELVEELVVLNDVEWDNLLAGLDDDELLSHMSFVRRKLGDIPASAYFHVNQVVHSVRLSNFPSISLLINLSFKTKAATKSLDSTQDLEDTLWIGMAVVKAVSATMQSMKDALAPSVQRNCIGSAFEENLLRAESAVREIRECYDTIVTDGSDSAS